MPIKKSKKTAIALAILSPLVLLAVFAGGEPEADDDLGAPSTELTEEELQEISTEQNRVYQKTGRWAQVLPDKRAVHAEFNTQKIPVRVKIQDTGDGYIIVHENAEEIISEHYKQGRHQETNRVRKDSLDFYNDPTP